MKKVILCPNPYRDNDLLVAKQSKDLLEQVGFETVVCLPFQRDGYNDLGMPIRPLQQEIKSADLLLKPEWRKPRRYRYDIFHP